MVIIGTFYIMTTFLGFGAAPSSAKRSSQKMAGRT